MDLDVGGLILTDVALSRRDLTVHVDAMRLGPWTGGVGAVVAGLRIERRPTTPQPDAEPPSTGHAGRAEDAGRKARSSLPMPQLAWLDRLGLDAGLLVEDAELPAFAIGPLAPPHVHALRIRRRAGGTYEMQGIARADLTDGTSYGVRLVAERSPASPLSFSAEVRSGRSSAFAMQGVHDERRTEVEVRARAGGRARAVIDADAAARLDFEAFGLGDLDGPLRLVVGPAIDVSDAELSGSLTFRKDGSTVSGQATGLEISRLRIVDGRIADGAVTVEAFGFDGIAHVSANQQTASGTVHVGDVAVEISAHRTDAVVAMDALLPPTSCQALFDSAPTGLLPHLAGARFAGTLSGSLHFRIDPSRIGSVDGDTTAMLDDPPGELDLALPYPTACTMILDPPGIDVVGLQGPYVHRFRGDDGRLRRKVLAPADRDFVPLDRARRAAHALVTMEDTRFYEHDGFDREQMQRAFWHNLLRGRVERGASTISQQLARNLWLGGRRTLSRKLEEAVLTARLEQVVSKDRILEAYINVIELGPEVYGVGEAARHHFGKPVTRLSILESLYLASLAPAPRTLSLAHHRNGIPDAWVERLRQQARRMALHGFVSWNDARRARTERIALSSRGD
ncbi:MAG: hypothetical protein D6705_07325 [Deltaproteobacteria bacterium]|nr:MAG: hypothetical protein D6705_07325 [Deltaproteobacteria bacterium]